MSRNAVGACRSRRTVAMLCAMLCACTAVARAAETKAGTTTLAPVAAYQVHHTLTVKQIPAGSKRVRIWFWIPQEDPYQRVLDLTVPQAPEGYRIVRDAEMGHTQLYAEVENPKTETITLVTDALVLRRGVSLTLDPEKAGTLTDQYRQAFRDDLRGDVPFMKVDTRISDLAQRICGSETNVIRQARLLYNYVVENTRHYSRGEGAPKSSNRGDADYCLMNGGGACTDLHALFMALARARAIPTRIYFGSRLMPANAGKDIDPGYRCWVAFFAPNYGWVPCDLAAANTIPEKKDFYFGGLDERRLLFSNGRDFDLSPKQDGPRLNLFIRAYVEVDGKPFDSFDRSLRFTETDAAENRF